MTACHYDLPDHFDDKTVVDAFKSSFLSNSTLWPFNIAEERSLHVELVNRKAYPLICGLLLKLRTAMFRVAKRSRMREVSLEDTYEERLYRLMKCFLRSDFDSSFLIEWTPKTLFLAGTELARKSVFLSAKLQKELNDQPLKPLSTGNVIIYTCSVGNGVIPHECYVKWCTFSSCMGIQWVKNIRTKLTIILFLFDSNEQVGV